MTEDLDAASTSTLTTALGPSPVSETRGLEIPACGGLNFTFFEKMEEEKRTFGSVEYANPLSLKKLSLPDLFTSS